MMLLEDALHKTGVAEALYDRYTAVAKEDEDEEGNPVLTLTIQVEAMPPFYSHDCKDAAEVLAIMHHTSAPDNLEWNSVETEC